MRPIFRRPPTQLRFILFTYLAGMAVFTLLRAVLIFANYSLAKQVPFDIMVQALLMGLRFDTVISGYFLILPLLLFFLFSFLKRKPRWLERFVFLFLMTVYSIGFFIVCADIPWYRQFQTRITAAALNWTNTPSMMLKIIFQDVRNYPFLIAFVCLIFIFYKAMLRIKRTTIDAETKSLSITKSTLSYIFFIGLTLTGIRGRIELKSPIRWGTAFFSQYNFANQVGLNPVYTFMRSWFDSHDKNAQRLNYMDDVAAVKNVKSYYGITPLHEFYSPVARNVTTEGEPKKYNIVLILMEGMSAKNMSHFGNINKLTPVLDSLFSSGVSLTHFYSDGNHTFNGIYSSLFGIPGLPMKHPMKGIENQQQYNGIAKTLSNNGYRTIFFINHDEQFDNVAGFLTPNGIQQIVSQKDYPSSKVISTLGVPDHVQFEEVVKRLSAIHQTGKPFFSAIMTASNHGPYIMPEGIPFKAHSPDSRTQMVEYSDWAIGKFLTDCKQQPWFDSTIFVFTGDHGNLIPGFEHYMAYHHIPLIIYAPKILTPEVMEKLGGQIDLYPSILHLLNISCTNNSFGIDLFREDRRYLPFTYDEQLCTISLNNLFVSNQSNDKLYSITADGKSLQPLANPTLADSMKVYTQSILQTTQWMIEKRKMY
jgi:phosphoglycerol transferase MdoB-like AlkP superfamily enzyme